jgi:YhcH/YjgK/YiaL family protein
MIVDQLQNAALYYAVSPGIRRALEFLQRPDLHALPAGRHEIQADDVYAMVADYKTRPLAEGKWEAHRRYIDVQFVASGREKIGYACTAGMTVTQAYDEKADYLLLSGAGDFLSAGPGTFLVLWPADAHMPGIAEDQPAAVRKIVVKVRV